MYGPAGTDLGVAKQPIDVGIQTNCMSCHAFANFNPRDPRVKNPVAYTGDRHVDLDHPVFAGKLKVDFLWSIPANAE